MASNLEEFVYQLANDQSYLDRFRADPKAVLAQTNLSGSEKDLVLSGDAKRISAAIGHGIDPPFVVTIERGSAAESSAGIEA
jgi:hypothetical protein